MIPLGEILEELEAIAPLHLAADWDNVGLLLGDPRQMVASAMTCLTLTPGVVAEALQLGIELIVTHHPILFRGSKNLSLNTPEGRLLAPLLRAEIAVYSPHTAFDDAPGGINDSLARMMGLEQVRPLRPRPAGASHQVKLVVFVPQADTSRVADAIFAAGGGEIGAYRECSFRTPGAGTFFGTDSTHPAVGQKGRREEVAEERLEVVVPTARLERALQAMRAAHPYEEVAFDLYPLQPPPSSQGSGRIGSLPLPRSLREVAEALKGPLRVETLGIVGEPTREIQRIAVACGAAGEFLADAARENADLFVTGELRFHDYLAAQARGVALIVTGHYASERPAVEALAGRLHHRFPGLPCRVSRQERDPVQWV